MNTDPTSYEVVEGRQVVAAVDGGEITSDAGALLLGATDRAIGLVERSAICFDDGHMQAQVEHSVAAMVAQLVFGIAFGYEDLVDYDRLRHDPVLATLAGKLGAKRQNCAPLAGKSTLNRLEHAPSEPSRYNKIGHGGPAIERLFVDLSLEAHSTPPRQIILDLNATDDPLHGHQEGRFFHGFYDCYCYLPLYIFCSRHLFATTLRRSNIDTSAGAKDAVARIVAQIRARWPGEVEILLRADSGITREELMACCEAHNVGYVFGLARNNWLAGAIAAELAAAEADSLDHGGLARRFADFFWRTLDSWSPGMARGGQGRAFAQDPNPRFVVTSLPIDAIDARALYENVYCAHGQMENRIKEQQLNLFADRTSAATMAGNQLGLWFASMAHILLAALCRIGLRHTQYAAATCGTIRLKLLKIGAQLQISVRRIKVAMASACPYQAEYHPAYLHLKRAPFRTTRHTGAPPHRHRSRSAKIHPPALSSWYNPLTPPARAQTARLPAAPNCL